MKLITEKFEEMDPNDERVRNIKLVLITAQCSRSGVTNPVNFIVNEGDGIAAARASCFVKRDRLLLPIMNHTLTNLNEVCTVSS